MSAYWFETVIIFNPKDKEALELSKAKYTDKLRKWSKPKKLDINDMGERNLAYPLHDCTTGYYIVFTWYGTPDMVSDLETILRADDAVLKFMTLRMEDYEGEEYIEEDKPEEVAVAATASEQVSKDESQDVWDLIFDMERSKV